MRLHRFYSKEVLTESVQYKYEPHIHQWKNVFRYEAGDSVILFGDGLEHTYTIETITKKEAVLREQSKSDSRMQDGELALGIALIKRDNFELVLQKCTEIGVTEFIPLITDRSLQKMFGIERLEKILIEATEQSGWGRVPELSNPKNLTNVLSSACIVLDINGENTSQAENSTHTSTLLVGPEGGWSDGEMTQMLENKVNLWSLKTGVLRAETAAIVACGIIKNTP